MEFGLAFEFAKQDATGRFVRGWASVISDNGEVLTDHQGDIIEMTELRKAAHDFITNARVAKAMHKGDGVGTVVESVIIDDDFAKALGINDGRRGWWIGMEIHDPKIREQVRKGKLRAFSIGGRGRRKTLED